MRLGLCLAVAATSAALAAPPPVLAQGGLMGEEGNRMIPGGQPLLMASSPLPSPSPATVLGASPSPAARASVLPAPRPAAPRSTFPPTPRPAFAPPGPGPGPVRASASPPWQPQPMATSWEAPIWDPSTSEAMGQVPVGYSPLGQALVFQPLPGLVPLLVERENPPRLLVRLPAGKRWAPGLPGETWPVRGPSGPVAQVLVSQDGRELIVSFVGARPRYALIPAADGRLAIAFGGPDRAAAALAASPRPLPSPVPVSPSPTPSVLITPEPVPWRSGGPPPPTPRPTPQPSPVAQASPPPSPQAAPSPSEPVVLPSSGLVVVTPPPLPDFPSAWASAAPPVFGGRLSLDGALALSLQEQLPADGFDANASLVPAARLRWEPLLSPNVGFWTQLTGIGAKYDEGQLKTVGLEGLLAREAYDLNLALLGRLPLPGGLELAATPGFLLRAVRAEASAGRPGILSPYRSSAWRNASSLSYGGGVGLGLGWQPVEAFAIVLKVDGYGLLDGLVDPSGGIRPYPMLGVRGDAEMRLMLGPLGLSAGYVLVEEVAAGADTTRTHTRRWSGPTAGVGLRF